MWCLDDYDGYELAAKSVSLIKEKETEWTKETQDDTELDVRLRNCGEECEIEDEGNTIVEILLHSYSIDLYQDQAPNRIIKKVEIKLKKNENDKFQNIHFRRSLL